jgi:3-mercaptopyruvate sulfurtransferase SseA
MSSAVSRPPAADSARALKHFESLLEFETDCWDVHHAITKNRMDFVLLDVRGEELFNRGHIEGAISLPHTRINENTQRISTGHAVCCLLCWSTLQWQRKSSNPLS